MLSQLTSLDAATAACPDPDRGVVWVVESGPPSLGALDLAGGTYTRHLPLASTPAGIALSGDGKDLLVAAEDGTVVAVSADDPAAGASPLADGRAPRAGRRDQA